MAASAEDLSVGERWAAALKRRYPGRKPGEELDRERCAEAFGVAVATVKSWAGGQAPYAEVLFRAARMHGPAIVFEVLVSAPDQELARLAQLDAALPELEARCKAMGDELAQLRLVRGR